MSPEAKKHAPIVTKTKTRLPKPKRIKFGDKDALELFKWWANFNEDQFGCCEAKVYRKYPVIDQVLVGERHAERIDLIEGKIPFEPDEYKDWFLHNYGSGKYSVIIDEKGVPGIVSGALFTVADDNYPPRVDLRTLVVGHPENRGFVEGQRARGVKLPWETNNEANQETGDNMNVAATVIEHVLEDNKDMREKVEELHEKQNAAPDPVATAAIRGFEVMAKGAEAGIEMAKTNAEAISKAAAPQWDPLAVLAKGIELANGKPDSNASLMTVLPMIIEMNRGQMAQVQAMHQQTIELMKLQQQRPEPKNPLDVLRELKEGIELLGLGRGNRSDAPALAPTKSWAAILMENPEVMQTLGSFGTSVMQALVAYWTRGGGAVPAVNPAPSTNGQGPQIVTRPDKPIETPQQVAAREATQQFLKMIETPLLSHFFDEGRQQLNGYTFAHAMHQGLQPKFNPNSPITPDGRQNYLIVRDQWGDKFRQLVEEYQPIAQYVLGNKPRWKEFLGEFMNYDNWVSAQQQPPVGTPA